MAASTRTKSFRIFNEIAQYEHDAGGPAEIAYMVDQSHNLKPKLEAMVQTACEAQKQMARAHLVDRDALARFQVEGDIVGAEGCLKAAFEADVSGVLGEWRQSRNLPADPLAELAGQRRGRGAWQGEGGPPRRRGGVELRLRRIHHGDTEARRPEEKPLL